MFELWRHKPYWDGPQAGLLLLGHSAREIDEEYNSYNQQGGLD